MQILLFSQVGAIQNKIVTATTEPIEIQRNSIFAKITKIIQAAAADDVNIVCLQEAWSECKY